MTAAFELVKANLMRCTPEERNKLKMLIARHPGTAVQKTAVSVNEFRNDWLLQGILDELRRRGHRHKIQNYAEVRKLCDTFEMDSTAVRRELEHQLARHVSDPRFDQLLTLGFVSAQALARYIASWDKGPPVALKPMLQLVNRTLEAIERSFPNYLASGMIYVLVQRNRNLLI